MEDSSRSVWLRRQIYDFAVRICINKIEKTECQKQKPHLCVCVCVCVFFFCFVFFYKWDNICILLLACLALTKGTNLNLEFHYENMPIQIYRKFHLQKLKVFRW